MFPSSPQRHCETRVSFPDDPFFARLLATAKRCRHSVIINDSADSIQADYAQILHDVHLLSGNASAMVT